MMEERVKGEGWGGCHDRLGGRREELEVYNSPFNLYFLFAKFESIFYLGKPMRGTI